MLSAGMESRPLAVRTARTRYGGRIPLITGSAQLSAPGPQGRKKENKGNAACTQTLAAHILPFPPPPLPLLCACSRRHLIAPPLAAGGDGDGGRASEAAWMDSGVGIGGSFGGGHRRDEVAT
jgi:hypothetical protein